MQNKKQLSNYLYNTFVADFETITQDTEYFKTHNKSGITYGVTSNMDNTFLSRYNRIDDMFFDIANAYKWKYFNIFFHNLSFDGVFILDWMGRNNFKYVEYVNKEEKTFTVFRTTGGRIYNISIFYLGRTWSIKCSKMLLSASVKQLGKCVKIDKYKSASQETEEFYNVEPLEDLQEFERKNADYCLYCARDVDIVRISLLSFFQSLMEFLQEFNASDEWYDKVMRGSTISQISLQLQLMCAEKNGINNDELFITNPKEREIMDQFTNGGLTICNHAYQKQQQETADGYVIDLKSAYPSVMIRKLPYGEMLSEPPKECEYCVFQEVFYEKLTPKNHQIPLLKNWTNKGANYFIEAENYTTYLLKDELLLLEKFYNYEGKRVINQYYYKLKSYLYDFVSYGYKMKELYKKERNLAASHTFKILLNSAYGIHAKRADFKLVKPWKGEIWEDKKKEYSYASHIDLNKTHRHSYIPNNKLYAYKPDGFIDESLFVASHKGIANYITAQTRCKILKGILHFKPENFLYCDTDSLFLINTSLQEINNYCGDRLGDWELEKEFKKGLVVRSKLYELRDADGKIIKSGTAGIRKGGVDLESSINEDTVTIKSANKIPFRVWGGIILVSTDKILNMNIDTNLHFIGPIMNSINLSIKEAVKNKKEKNNE